LSAGRPQVPAGIVGKLRATCLALPEAYEEVAWTGLRWKVRKATFAHVLAIDQGWPPAYAKAAGADGPMTVLTFRSGVAGLDPRHYAERPFFRPSWWPDIVGLEIGPQADWAEIAGLVRASYCVLAPQKLAKLVGRPGA
jgi:hypothetical protein